MMFTSAKVNTMCKQILQNEIEIIVIGSSSTHTSSFSSSSSDNKNKDKKYTKREIKSLCQALSQNESIKSVSLVGKNINGYALRNLLPIIASLPNLKILELKHLGAVTFSPQVLKTLSKCKKLQKLVIHYSWIQTNDMDHESYFNFASLLPHFRRLSTLDLTGCGMGDKQVLDIIRYLVVWNSNLDELCLADNWRISTAGLAMLSQVTNVRRLDLSGCDIRGRELFTFANSMVKSESSFEALDLSNNEDLLEGDNDETMFLPFFQACAKGLKHLNVSNCGVNNDQISIMFEALKAENESSTLEFLAVTDSPPVHFDDVQELLSLNDSLRCLVLNEANDEGATPSLVVRSEKV